MQRSLNQITLSSFSPRPRQEERQVVNISDATKQSSFNSCTLSQEVCVCVCVCARERQRNRRGIRCLVTDSFVYSVIKSTLVFLPPSLSKHHVFI